MIRFTGYRIRRYALAHYEGALVVVTHDRRLRAAFTGTPGTPPSRPQRPDFLTVGPVSFSGRTP
ncbi:hypothetical protein [Nonomuraea sp. NPDC052265]|uniref:hypothetical protein n=1 Tax=Nonomuraea sp. NPDC052265 TaxID=3364374 RepID=UPI0037CB7BFA